MKYQVLRTVQGGDREGVANDAVSELTARTAALFLRLSSVWKIRDLQAWFSQIFICWVRLFVPLPRSLKHACLSLWNRVIFILIGIWILRSSVLLTSSFSELTSQPIVSWGKIPTTPCFVLKLRTCSPIRLHPVIDTSVSSSRFNRFRFIPWMNFQWKYFGQRNRLTKQVGLIEIVGELARMDLPSQFVFHIKLHSTSQCAPWHDFWNKSGATVCRTCRS